MLSAVLNVSAVMIFFKDLLHVCCFWLAACTSHRADLAQANVTAVPLLQTTCSDGDQMQSELFIKHLHSIDIDCSAAHAAHL